MAALLDGSAPTADRLASALFAATLIHGVVILGITFAPATLAPPAENPTLDVTLITGPADPAPESAQAYAQQSQRGSGIGDAERASALPSNLAPTNNPGSTDANDWNDSAPGRNESTPQVVASRQGQTRINVETQDEAPEDSFRREAVLMLATNLTNAPLDDLEALPEQEQVERDYLSVDALESSFATYLASWKQSIERVGTLNYPDDIRRRGLSGNPILEVAINADGSLHEIVVRRSSDYRVLDQAALRILQLAAPFEAFPDEIRKEYDVLRFVYEWQFLDGTAAGGSISMAVDEG